jgi:hypothetical protein
MSEIVNFKPRDANFHLMVAAICIGVSLFSTAILYPHAMVCVLISAAGGMNVGVVVESQRWKKRNAATARPLTIALDKHD